MQVKKPLLAACRSLLPYKLLIILNNFIFNKIEAVAPGPGLRHSSASGLADVCLDCWPRDDLAYLGAMGAARSTSYREQTASPLKPSPLAPLLPRLTKATWAGNLCDYKRSAQTSLAGFCGHRHLVHHILKASPTSAPSATCTKPPRTSRSPGSPACAHSSR